MGQAQAFFEDRDEHIDCDGYPNLSCYIAKSLVGNYREEHLLALTQAVALYETLSGKIEVRSGY